MKFNHNELLTYPNKFDQRLFANVRQAHDMGAAAVGATIYFGSEESSRQIEQVSAAFAKAHELGLADDSLVLSAQPRVQNTKAPITMRPPT